MIILKKSLNLWNGQKLLKYKTVRDTKEIGALKRIASFCVDHDQLDRGMYISRIDGDVITYDIRMKKPNGGDYLFNKAIHTFQHLFATYVRNSAYSDSIIYVGPMGCRTGFYFLTRDTISPQQALELVKKSMEFIRDFQGEIPGSKRWECGNYQEHDLAAAQQTATDMLPVLSSWTVEKMHYPKLLSEET